MALEGRVATWMVENGSHHMLMLSPSIGRPVDDQRFIAELKSQGCMVVAVATNIARSDDVKQVITGFPLPITCVLHMALVLREEPTFQETKFSFPLMALVFYDQLLSGLTFDELTSPRDPNAQGCLNLHCALEDANLDFFTVFSSICGLVGNRTQVNYAAANHFLDSFV